MHMNTAIDTVYPLRHVRGCAQPFPTIYWLRDPAIDRALAELERKGAIGRFEDQLAGAPALLARYHLDHARYRDARWAMLSDVDRAIVEGSPSLTRAFETGIAGIADFNHIKCLHAQYAFHLARQHQGGTTVGQLIDAQWQDDSGEALHRKLLPVIHTDGKHAPR